MDSHSLDSSESSDFSQKLLWLLLLAASEAADIPTAHPSSSEEKLRGDKSTSTQLPQSKTPTSTITRQHYNPL